MRQRVPGSATDPGIDRTRLLPAITHIKLPRPRGTKIGALLALKQWLGPRLMNDYKNRTYGHRLPAAPLGAAISGFWPARRRQAEHSVRHFRPKDARRGPARCRMRQRRFVKLAASLGYRAVGDLVLTRRRHVGKIAGLDVRI